MSESEDYRAKNARAGKAIYVPGKTVDQLEVAEADCHTRLSPRSIALTDEEWSMIDTAITDVIEIVGDVRNVVHDLAYIDDLDQPLVNSMMRLVVRAIDSMETKELHVLDRLDTAIRHSDRETRK